MNPSGELGMAEDDLRTAQIALSSATKRIVVLPGEMWDATLEARGDIAKAGGMVESALKHLVEAHAAADETPEPKEGGRA